MSQTYSLDPIGFISSPYKEKFGIPRQPGLAQEVVTTLKLTSPYNQADIVRDIETFSHLWLVFIFHGIPQNKWKTLVRPPRLGGNKRVGVFASRSTFRPNPIGLSAVELQNVDIKGSSITLTLTGCDLLDGTPILDIKPYISYSDAIPDANSGFAPCEPKHLKVHWTKVALQQAEQKSKQFDSNIPTMIEQILQQDPRPAYRHGQSDEREYAMKLYDFDLKWIYQENSILITALQETNRA